MNSEFSVCSQCGGKAYKVGTDDDYTEHCWDCDNVDRTVTIDFGSDSGWKPMKRAD